VVRSPAAYACTARTAPRAQMRGRAMQPSPQMRAHVRADAHLHAMRTATRAPTQPCTCADELHEHVRARKHTPSQTHTHARAPAPMGEPL
jgi:hypothetical protein